MYSEIATAFIVTINDFSDQIHFSLSHCSLLSNNRGKIEINSVFRRALLENMNEVYTIGVC